MSSFTVSEGVSIIENLDMIEIEVDKMRDKFIDTKLEDDFDTMQCAINDFVIKLGQVELVIYD